MLKPDLSIIFLKFSSFLPFFHLIVGCRRGSGGIIPCFMSEFPRQVTCFYKNSLAAFVFCALGVIMYTRLKYMYAPEVLTGVPKNTKSPLFRLKTA